MTTLNTSLPESSNYPPTPCGICLHTFQEGALNQCCTCGEYHCDTCPAYACCCDDSDDPTFHALRVALREAAIELERLKASESLTEKGEARLKFLTSVVPMIRADVNTLDEIRDGDYEDAPN